MPLQRLFLLRCLSPPLLQTSEDDMSDIAEITRRGICSMQVCVPKSWTDDQVVDFATAYYTCQTRSHGVCGGYREYPERKVYMKAVRG